MYLSVINGVEYVISFDCYFSFSCSVFISCHRIKVQRKLMTNVRTEVKTVKILCTYINCVLTQIKGYITTYKFKSYIKMLQFSSSTK